MKLKGILSGVKKKCFAMVATTALLLTMTVSNMAFAAATTPAPVDFSGLKTAVTSSFDMGQIAVIIAAILGICVTPVLLWWGGRKLVHAAQQALQRGKLKL